MSAGRDDRNGSAPVRAVDAFVEGNGALARLLREQPEWPMPADMSARFASTLAHAEAELDARRQRQRAMAGAPGALGGFEPPASLEAAVLAAAARIDAAQAPRREAVLRDVALHDAVQADAASRDTASHAVLAGDGSLGAAAQAWLHAQAADARRAATSSTGRLQDSPRSQAAARPARLRGWFGFLGGAVAAMLAAGIALNLWRAPMAPDVDEAAAPATAAAPERAAKPASVTAPATAAAPAAAPASVPGPAPASARVQSPTQAQARVQAQYADKRPSDALRSGSSAGDLGRARHEAPIALADAAPPARLAPPAPPARPAAAAPATRAAPTMSSPSRERAATSLAKHDRPAPRPYRSNSVTASEAGAAAPPMQAAARARGAVREKRAALAEPAALGAPESKRFEPTLADDPARIARAWPSEPANTRWIAHAAAADGERAADWLVRLQLALQARALRPDIVLHLDGATGGRLRIERADAR